MVQVSQMHRLRTEQRRRLGGLFGVAFVLFTAASGCGQELGCAELCAKEHDCRQSFQDSGVIPTDEDACLTTCESLSEDDPAYADAVAERAACYMESDTTCDAIAFGFACTVSGE